MILPQDIKNKKVIISPLDWGMGHLTRSVSIIQQLLSQQNEVHFAGNEKQIEFINKDFPGIKTKFLQGYEVKLDSRRSTYWQLLIQTAGVTKAIKQENNFLIEEHEKENYDFIISDNRYGFYHKKVPSIMITHQLKLKVPAFKMFVNYTIKSYLNKFSQIWVPDDKSQSLCGELTQQKLNVPVHFIGFLSRFKDLKCETKYATVFIMSGPEPERSRFEKLCIRAIENGNKKYAIVGSDYNSDKCDSFNNPTTVELERIINESDLVVSRAGYTTIMEMQELDKNCILIPTSGQYEQEYLADTIKIPKIKFNTEKEFFIGFIA